MSTEPKVLPERFRAFLAKLWPYTLTMAFISMLIGLYIAITGNIPGLSNADPNRILAIDLSFVFIGGLGMFLLSFVCGFAYDIQQQMQRELIKRLNRSTGSRQSGLQDRIFR